MRVAGWLAGLLLAAASLGGARAAGTGFLTPQEAGVSPVEFGKAGEAAAKKATREKYLSIALTEDHAGKVKDYAKGHVQKYVDEYLKENYLKRVRDPGLRKVLGKKLQRHLERLQRQGRFFEARKAYKAGDKVALAKEISLMCGETILTVSSDYGKLLPKGAGKKMAKSLTESRLFLDGILQKADLIAGTGEAYGHLAAGDTKQATVVALNTLVPGAKEVNAFIEAGVAANHLVFTEYFKKPGMESIYQEWRAQSKGGKLSAKDFRMIVEGYRETGDQAMNKTGLIDMIARENEWEGSQADHLRRFEGLLRRWKRADDLAAARKDRIQGLIKEILARKVPILPRAKSGGLTEAELVKAVEDYERMLLATARRLCQGSGRKDCDPEALLAGKDLKSRVSREELVGFLVEKLHCLRVGKAKGYSHPERKACKVWEHEKREELLRKLGKKEGAPLGVSLDGPKVAEAGATIEVTVVATGGRGPFTFSVHTPAGGKQEVDTAGRAAPFRVDVGDQPGKTKLTYRVVDRKTKEEKGKVRTLKVRAGFGVRIVGPPVVEVGQKARYKVRFKNGAPRYDYSIEGSALKAPKSGETDAREVGFEVVAPAKPGELEVVAVVTDGKRRTASASRILKVGPKMAVRFLEVPGPVASGAAARFKVALDPGGEDPPWDVTFSGPFLPEARTERVSDRVLVRAFPAPLVGKLGGSMEQMLGASKGLALRCEISKGTRRAAAEARVKVLEAFAVAFHIAPRQAAPGQRLVFRYMVSHAAGDARVSWTGPGGGGPLGVVRQAAMPAGGHFQVTAPSSPGTYTLTLTARQPDGKTATASHTLKVKAGLPPPATKAPPATRAAPPATKPGGDRDRCDEKRRRFEASRARAPAGGGGSDGQGFDLTGPMNEDIDGTWPPGGGFCDSHPECCR